MCSSNVLKYENPVCLIIINVIGNYGFKRDIFQFNAENISPVR